MRLTILVFALILPFLSTAQREIIDDIVATIGGEVILLSEIEEQISLAEAQQASLPENARCQILDNLLSQKLILNQAKLDSIEVSSEEVEAQLDARIERILAYMNGDETQFEEYYGQSISQVKDEFREDLNAQILAERMQGMILSEVKITPAEVKNFFDQIPADSLPYFNSEVEIAEIVYKPKVNKTEKGIALDKIKDLRKKIVEDGENFEELAAVFSDDVGSAKQGGSLGWAKRNSYVPEFEAAAYKLEKGEVSQIVETQYGYHIIQLIERRGNTINARHILVKPKITQADLDLSVSVLDSFRNLILVDTLDFGKTVKQISDENQQSYNNNGNLVNQKSGNTFFEIGDLEPDIYFAIDSLAVGGVTRPIEVSDFAGEKSYKLIKLISRSQPHKADLKTDYSRIQKAALESKKGIFISNWVGNKIGSTYINVDPQYDNCDQLKDRWKLN